MTRGVAGPRLLFVPVSGKYGMGEYVRSLTLAQAFAAQWAGASIHFVLSAQATYAAAIGFANTRLPASPTLHTPQVVALIEKLRPDAVIFDNAGRTAQLAAAQRVGAKIIYISARPRQRRKAFRWRWLRMLDEHWIAYPEFVAGSLSLLERAKLTLAGAVRVRFLDVILPPPATADANQMLTQCGLMDGSYVLLVPGGGTAHPGAVDPIAVFEQAALAIAARALPAVMVAPLTASMAASSGLHRLAPMPLATLLALMSRARIVVTNGGSSLLQAIAQGVACVAVPLVKDQVVRVERCHQRQVALRAQLNAASIEAACTALLCDPQRLAGMRASAKTLALGDGIQIATRSLGQLLQPPA